MDASSFFYDTFCEGENRLWSCGSENFFHSFSIPKVSHGHDGTRDWKIRASALFKISFKVTQSQEENKPMVSRRLI
jgi:hypothetical protein